MPTVIAASGSLNRGPTTKLPAGSLVVLWLMLLMLASGCAMRPQIPGTGLNWDQREVELGELENWQAHGRIAVKSDDGGGQGKLHWYQTDAHARIQLSGPFGVGAYELAWDSDSLVVRTKAGEVTAAYAGPQAAEQFLVDQLGWSFPAISVRYWILGIVDPQFASSRQFDRDGWLIGIEQNDWSIAYDGFSLYQDQWLPKKIVMQNDSSRVKLIVDKWGL
jgi:outer membrane lipoprotein LolB